MILLPWLCELILKIYLHHTVRQLNIVTGVIEHACFFCWPDGLWVDVDRSDPLQQKLHHFQERIGGLFWECQLPSDLPLQGVKTDIFMDTHRLQEVATRLHSNILSTYLTSCSNKLVFSLTHTHTNMQNTHQLFHIMQIKNTNTLLNMGVWHFLMQILQCLLWKSCHFWLCTSGSCYTEASLMCVYSAQSFSSVLLTQYLWAEKLYSSFCASSKKHTITAVKS